MAVVITTKEGGFPHCALCGHEHPRGSERPDACDALRVAAEAGARPAGVPVRVHAAYVEARQALRANAPSVAIRVLQWLLSHLAETRGADPSLTLSAKVAALAHAGVISDESPPENVEQATSSTASPEMAWALMTLVEHALARAYLRRGAA